MIARLGATIGVVGGVALWPLVGFAVCAALFLLSSRRAQRLVADLVERTVADIRFETANKVRHAGFAAFEAVGPNRISTALTKDARTVSAAAEIITQAWSSGVIVLCTPLFIAYRRTRFFVVCLLLLAGLSRYIVGMSGLLKRLGAALLVEVDLFDSLDHLLKGFKELKLNARKSFDLFTNYFSRLALDLEQRAVGTAKAYVDTHLMLVTACFLAMGAVVFVLPRYSRVNYVAVYEIAVMLAFMMGPLQKVLLVLPVLDKAGVALDSLETLARDLESLDTAGPERRRTRSAS